MSHSVYTIGKHYLDTSSVKKLAFDTGTRLGTNVSYGYRDDWIYEQEKKESIPTYSFIKQGEVIIEQSDGNIILEDRLFQARQIYKEHGEETWKIPYIKKSSYFIKEIETAISNLYYDLTFEHDEYFIGSLYNDVFNYRHDYPGDWWWLCRKLNNENASKEDVNFINGIRNYILSFFDLLGGNAVVYFDDQWAGCDIFEEYKNWDDIISHIHSNLEQSKPNNPAFKTIKQFIDSEGYAVAFYDDFSDLVKTGKFRNVFMY